MRSSSSKSIQLLLDYSNSSIQLASQGFAPAELYTGPWANVGAVLLVCHHADFLTRSTA